MNTQGDLTKEIAASIADPQSLSKREPDKPEVEEKSLFADFDPEEKTSKVFENTIKAIAPPEVTNKLNLPDDATMTINRTDAVDFLESLKMKNWVAYNDGSLELVDDLGEVPENAIQTYKVTTVVDGDGNVELVFKDVDGVDADKFIPLSTFKAPSGQTVETTIISGRKLDDQEQLQLGLNNADDVYLESDVLTSIDNANLDQADFGFVPPGEEIVVRLKYDIGDNVVIIRNAEPDELANLVYVRKSGSDQPGEFKNGIAYSEGATTKAFEPEINPNDTARHTNAALNDLKQSNNNTSQQALDDAESQILLSELIDLNVGSYIPKKRLDDNNLFIDAEVFMGEVEKVVEVMKKIEATEGININYSTYRKGRTDISLESIEINDSTTISDIIGDSTQMVDGIRGSFPTKSRKNSQ